MLPTASNAVLADQIGHFKPGLDWHKLDLTQRRHRTAGKC